MDTRLSPIFARRSVRSYTTDPVADETVRSLLEAAMAAPSARACDPWRFVVVRDGQRRQAIADLLPYGTMIAKAPLGIVVCGDLNAAHDGQLSYLLQDCSAAIENLLLAASMLGLGACWLGVHPREDRVNGMASLLGLPERVVPVSAIAVGWPAEEHRPRTRYAEQYVHNQKW
jgi:nitroreductase